MTGRAAGYCAGYSVPGYVNPVGGYGRELGRRRGRGFGRGWGRGFGRRQFVYPQPIGVQLAYPQPIQPIVQPQTPEQEAAAWENYQKGLEAEKADLEQEMGGVKARIEELKAKVEKQAHSKQEGESSAH
jgi:hypothetical protein